MQGAVQSGNTECVRLLASDSMHVHKKKQQCVVNLQGE